MLIERVANWLDKFVQEMWDGLGAVNMMGTAGGAEQVQAQGDTDSF